MLKNSIPFVDLRGKSPIDLLRMFPDKARLLITAARKTYGWASYLASLAALPIADRLSYQWLKRAHNPYLYEIESFAEILGMKGTFAVNTCFEWGCTGGVWRTGETISMLRVLDWPFPQLGHHIVIVLQQGSGGEFYNITWPGMAGIFTGMAPGRFSAALHQAPMRKHGRGFIGDWLTGRIMMGHESALPPSHVLRRTFEKAEHYEHAKSMLMQTPIALPCIFLLAGIEPGQGCIIERLENMAEVHELSAGLQITAANHFTSKLSLLGMGWRPREIDNAGRYRQSLHITEADLSQPHFHWLQSPILNANTRLCMVCDATTQRLMVQGFDGIVPASSLFTLAPVSNVTRQAL